MIIIIFLLHITTIIDLSFTWSEIDRIFVDHGQNLLTKFVVYISPGTVTSIGAGVVGAICSILADSTMIWRCWLVWGRRWLAILLPVMFLISATGTITLILTPAFLFGTFLCVAFKIVGTYKGYTNPFGSIFGYVIYTSFMLASTLWCTSLIIYRIVTVARAGGGLRDYRHVLEVLVESSAFYSITLILCIAFLARNDISLIYFDTLAAAARGIALTLLVGRVAAGHARPDSSWQGSVLSGSIHFSMHSASRSSQPDSMTGHDLEAPQQEIVNEYRHSTPVADSQEGGDVSVNSGSHDICQDSSDIQLERDVEYGHHT
ncbi:hypothetical protein ARMSODRAFT_1023692 [Armillaria solidipes]|uniref:Uncharacterized protein n=1 Tax=Armillaria solidipes TaxID=1076256 RepID=A0A2H3BGT6_9AGAR|nr:hypothetical protein ARMSODRAFT_1023692 [Armillaria solidipes]